MHALIQVCSLHHEPLLHLSPPRGLQLCLQALHLNGHRWQLARPDCTTSLLPHVCLVALSVVWPWCRHHSTQHLPFPCCYLLPFLDFMAVFSLPASCTHTDILTLVLLHLQGFGIPADTGVPQVLQYPESRALPCLCSPNQSPASTLLLHNGARQKEEGKCHAYFHL